MSLTVAASARPGSPRDLRDGLPVGFPAGSDTCSVASSKSASRPPRPRRRATAPLTVDLPVIRSGWPTGISLLSEGCLASIEALADDPPAGTLVVLVSPFSDVAADSVDLLARGILGSAFTEDYLRPEPSGDSWTVGDLEGVLSVVQRVPRSRHVVVLRNVDRMDKRVFDRLLLLLEDPPTPLLLLLTVSRAELLPGTIRGRATVTLPLEVLSATQRVQALVAKGVSPADASEAVDLAGERPSLAGLLALEPSLRALGASVLDPVFPVADTVRAASVRLEEVSTLAAVLLAVRKNPGEAVSVKVSSYEDLSPEGKGLARELLALMVGRRRRFLLGLLTDLPATRMPVWEESLAALELFSRRIGIPVTPLLALARLFEGSAGLVRSSNLSVSNVKA